MNLNERIIGYDIMRIIAASMVVAIHSNVYFLDIPNKGFDWVAVMILTSLCVVSVPLFFMVSGSGNLVKQNLTSVADIFKIKIPKIFIPFLIWSLIYIIIRISAGKIKLTTGLFLSLIWEPAYYQFWFMYSLFGIYLCIPILQYLVIKSPKSLLQYVLAFWFVGSIILPAITRFVPWFKLSNHFDLIFLEGYWGYFVLGGYLLKYPPKNERKVGIYSLVLGTIITIICAILEWQFVPADRYQGYVYSAYLLPGATLMTLGVFILLQKVKIKDKYRKTIEYFSGLTMGVFYIHFLFITAFEMVFKQVDYTLVNALIKLIVMLFISFGTCVIWKKIKLLNRYLL